MHSGKFCKFPEIDVLTKYEKKFMKFCNFATI